MSKRVFVLAFATFMVLSSISLAIWMARRTPPLDQSGIYGITIVAILPALLLGIFNRALTFAIVLLGLAAWMYLSVALYGGAFG